MTEYINPKGEEICLDGQDVVHPEGKIKLLDGREIEGFPRQTRPQEVDNRLSLDTTGEYLQIRRKKPVPQAKDAEAEKAERERLENLFYENAFFFMVNRERILSDSRMFLAPVAVVNGLAYTGTSGFHRPTLGIYIEWWSNCMGSRVVADDGTTELVWVLSGSPLSGRNCCYAVNEQGLSRMVRICRFINAWSPFMHINSRYDECKSKYEAYTLEEVLAILHKKQPGYYTSLAEDYSLRLEKFVLGMKVEGLTYNMYLLKQRLDQETEEKQNLWKKFTNFRISHNLDKAKKLLAEYNDREKYCQQQLELQNQRRRTAKANKANYTATEFQNEMSDVKRQKEQFQRDLYQFKKDGLDELFPDGDVGLGDISDYINNVEKKNQFINKN